jgi:hypothetical protein
MFLTNV